MYKTIAKTTIKIPARVNQSAPFFSIKSPNFFPKRLVKYATKKKRSPLVKRQMKKNTGRLKLITPLVIVNTLNGRGVNPAKNIMPNQVKNPPFVDILSCISKTLSSYP